MIETNEGGDTNKESHQTNIRSFISLIIIIVAIVVPIRMFVAKPFIVSGTSMSPTFESFHYIIIDELSYRFNEPKRGDVIVIKYPLDPNRFFIKRLAGLPNETISIHGSTVTITNAEHPEGFNLDEPYVIPSNRANNEIVMTLGPDDYYVLGDNRSASADSRYWGILPKENIVGRAFIRLFPFTKINYLPGSIDSFQNK